MSRRYGRGSLLLLVAIACGCVSTPSEPEISAPPRAIEQPASDTSVRHALLSEIAALEEECATLRAQRTSLEKRVRATSNARPDRQVAVAPAPDEPPAEIPKFRHELAYRLVAGATSFTGSDTEESSETTNSTRALRVLLIREDASAIFRDLLKHGSSAGQLYALCGLYYVDRPTFDAVVPNYEGVRDVVEFAYVGYYLQTMEVGDVVKNYVMSPDFRAGVAESDYWLPALDLGEEFDLRRYRDRLSEVRLRFLSLERRLVSAVPEDDEDACDGLVAYAAVDPRWALPRLLKHLSSNKRVVRRQAGNILATLAPWAALILDDVLDLYREGDENEVGEITNILLEEDLWHFAPLKEVTEFLDPEFVSDSASPVVAAGYDDVCDLVVEALLERPDLHDTGVEFLLRIIAASDGEHVETVVANLLVRGPAGVERLLEAHRAAGPEQQRLMLQALSEPSIRPWLPTALATLVPQTE